MNNSTRPLTPQTIYEMAANYFMIARVLQVAAEFDLFTPLARQAMSAEALARHLGLNVKGVELLAIACTALGLLEKRGNDYQVTKAAAALLVQGEPAYAGHLLAGSVGVYQDWLKLDVAIRTGKPVALPTRNKDTASLRQFVLGMHRSSQGPAHFVATYLDLRPKRKLLDVGGGAGTFALALCRQFPQLTATVLDLPEVTAVAQEIIAQVGLAARVQVRNADYTRDPLPPGHDVVLLCNVCHQETAATVQDLLQKAAAALRVTGTVIILDIFLNDEKSGPLSVALGALNQLIHHGGEVHAAGEIKQWLRQAGFGETRTITLPFPDLSLLVADKRK